KPPAANTPNAPTTSANQPKPATGSPTATAAPLPPKPVKVPKPPRPVPAKLPLPPIPDDFATELAQGKKALEKGAGLSKETSESAKQEAAYQFDVAEAMLRAAWEKNASDEQVISSFQELSKHSGAIALLKTPVVHAKAKGLVVLDASASVVPTG